MNNKFIERGTETTVKIFNNRSLATDYRTLLPFLKEGMSVLDVGCGTGAISKDIAIAVGKTGKVIGIDNTAKFIESGKSTYDNIQNLSLFHSDLFDFNTDEKFDLITSARTLQWLNNPKEALQKMKSMLKDGGSISILDYNHNDIEWVPNPPNSMVDFYETFLNWRKSAGMNNGIANDLSSLMEEIGLTDIVEINADEYYQRNQPNFLSKIGIWSRVADSKQMVDEGFLSDDLRLQAIEEYDQWIDKEAISMTMKLNEVRGVKSIK